MFDRIKRWFKKHTPTDAGLMKVHWLPSGQAQYANFSGPVEDLVWPKSQFPLLVYVFGDAEKWVKRPMLAWNAQLGFEVFRLDVGDSANVSVHVFPMADLVGGQKLGEGGETLHVKSAGRMAAVVRFNSTSIVESYQIVFHELGHVLGLAHDEFESSPMYPNVVIAPDASEGPVSSDGSYGSIHGAFVGQLALRVVTQPDRRLLRKLYAP